MLTLDIVNQFVLEHFSNVTVSKNGSHFHARCVLCGDSKKSLSKKRFHLEFNNGQPFWHCFNCNRSGSFLELYCELNSISISEAKKQLYKFDVNYLTQVLSPKKKKKLLKEIKFENHDYILKDSIGKYDEPEGYIQSKYKEDLLKFIKDRIIPEDFPIFIAYQGEYKGRIIIPIYNNGNIVYFQGRSLSIDEYGKKYKNPTLQKGSIILNKEKFNFNKYIIVTEGILDAIQVGTQGTSCLGSSVNESFISELLPLTNIGIIIVMDNDESGNDSIIDIIKNNKFANLLKFFLMPYKYKEIKDLNELKQKENNIDIYQFVVNNSYTCFEIQVKLAIGGNK